MKYEKSTEEKQEQAALYALGVLSQHEARAFEQQLREGDRQTEAELESFERVVQAIGYLAQPEEPPSYLLDVLTARLQKEDQVAARNSFAEASQTIVQSTAPLSANTQAQAYQASQVVTPFPEAKQVRKSSGLSFLPWAIAASLLVCALAGFFAWRNARNEAKASQEQMIAAKAEVEKLNKKVNQENEQVYELARINQALRSPNSKVIELAGQEVAPSAMANIYWDTNGNQWVVAANLPLAPAGKVYQLWFVTADAKINAGLIKTNESGHAFTVVDVPKNLANLAAAAITLEPEGGSAQPTMPIYTVGKITS